MKSLYNKHDVLLYDKSQKLIRLLQHHFGEGTQPLFCCNIDELASMDLKTVSVAYCCIENYKECSIVLKLQNKINRIMVITNSERVIERLSDTMTIYVKNKKTYPHNIIYEIYQDTNELNSI